MLIDEVLTPDSSRYWSATDYVAGRPQASFDKQYLRDWLIDSGLRNKPGVSLPDDVVVETKRKYEEARERVMGNGQANVHAHKDGQGGDEVSAQMRTSGSQTHGKKGMKGSEMSGIQTDQVADAIDDEARKAVSGKHGKKGVMAGEEAGLQTDQVTDAIESEAGNM